MEDSYISVHTDYGNQRHIYISITDFSFKNTLLKKPKKPNQKINKHTKKPNPGKITEIIEGIHIGILIQCYKYKERCRKNAIQ